MNTSTLHTKTTCSFLCNYTQGLLSYAQTDAVFALWLHTQLVDIEPPSLNALSHTKNIFPSLIPHSAESAQRRALWLLGELHFRMHHSDGEHVRAVLMEWAHERVREEPKAVLLGIAVGVLPIGIMGHMKIKREPMAIILRNTLQNKLYTPAFLRTLTTLTHRVVELGLHNAKGKTARLEPELGDWLFGHKAITLYLASQKTLNSIEMHVRTMQAPYASEQDERGATEALAITPALYVGELDEYDALEHVSLEDGERD